MGAKNSSSFILLLIIMIMFPFLQAAAAAFPLPCILQNGCQCNHSLPYHNFLDAQTYGTCIHCSPGWGGPTCGNRFVSCLNGGAVQDTATEGVKCVCPPQYHGDRCQHRQCVNTIGGTGSSHSAPVNPVNNQCNRCMKGFTGLSCEMCTKNENCPVINNAFLLNNEEDPFYYQREKIAKKKADDRRGGKTTTSTKKKGSSDFTPTTQQEQQKYFPCNTSMMAQGDHKTFECTMTDMKKWKKLLGDDRDIIGHVTMDCHKEGGFSDTAEKNGTCYATLSRREPNNAWVDPFFFCTMFNCTMTSVYSSSSTSSSNSSALPAELQKDITNIQIIFEIILLLHCVVFVLNAFVSTISRQKRIFNYCSISVVVVLTLFIFIMAVAMHRGAKLNSEEEDNGTGDQDVDVQTVYSCERTNCTCADNPPNPTYTPMCKTCFFGETILPKFSGAAKWSCDTKSNYCEFVYSEMASMVIGANCLASECVNPKFLPPAVKNDDVVNKAERREVETIVLVCVLLISTALVVFIHYMKSMNKKSELSDEFCALFKVNAPNTPPSVVNDETTAMNSSDENIINPGRSGRGLGDELRTQPPGDDELKEGENGDFENGEVEERSPMLINDTRRHSSPPRKMKEEKKKKQSGGGAETKKASISTSNRINIGSSSHSVAGAHCILRARSIGYSLPNSVSSSSQDTNNQQQQENIILEDINFDMEAGEVLAIMGPSGAGKTTLLDILSSRGKIGKVRGKLELNSVPVHHFNENGEPLSDGRESEYKALIGYVSQEDTLIPALTVEETIHFAAMLKLPMAFSQKAIQCVVEEVIHALKLDHCRHTLIGNETRRGISGGEKRRVSIATELVANPRILFLDEPTSGLDSCSAMHVMEAITSLAHRTLSNSSSSSSILHSMTTFFSFKPMIIFSIHQPSADIFNLFDKVLLLSKGSPLYVGPADQAVQVIQDEIGEGGGGEKRNEEGGHDDVISSPTTIRRDTHSHYHNAAEFLLQIEENLSPNERNNLIIKSSGSLCSPSYRQQDSNGQRNLQLQKTEGEKEVQQQRHDSGGGVKKEENETFPLSSLHPLTNDGEVLTNAMAMRKYYPTGWTQFFILCRRTRASLMGSYYLIACHAAVTFFVGLMLSVIYHSEGMDLQGTLNRAGCVTFLLLVVAFVSISCLELFMLERRLFIVERENGFYTTLPYYAAKLLFDLIPLRIVPSLLLGAIIYFPLGFRTDDGSYFLWFLFIIVVFCLVVTCMNLCVGMLAPSFGAAALLSSVLHLWNFVFSGLMVQSSTLPLLLRPFRLFSPFYLAFETLMINELNEQKCTFAPTDAAGKSTMDQLPLLCVQYLYNLGLDPLNFPRDVSLLVLWFFLYILVAWVLLQSCLKLKR